MPRLNNLWKEFAVDYNDKQYCGLCGDFGILEITLFPKVHMNRSKFCICPRGRALKLNKEEREKKSA